MNAMLSVLVSPKATFERIRDQGGHFAAPFIMVLLISALIVLLSYPVIEYELSQTPGLQGENAPDMAVSMTFIVITSLVTALIGSAASLFITGLLLMLVNLVVRGEAKYMQLVKVAIFASIPSLLQGLLTGLLFQFMDPADAMNIRFSLADLLDAPSGFVAGLANLVNPFLIWGLAIMVIGTAVMGRKNTKSVAVWLLSGWLVLRLAGIWIGTLFSGLTSM